MEKFLKYYTYGHWHISLCALSLYFGSNLYFTGDINWITSIHVFAATQFVYTLHRYVSSNRMMNQEENRYSFITSFKGYVYVLLWSSGIITLLSFIFLERNIQYLILISGMISMGYILPVIFRKRLRDIGGAKIFFISIVWAVLSILNSNFHLNPSANLAILGEHFFFIFALTIPFDIRDQSLDERAQVSNFTNQLSIKSIQYLLIGFICAAIALAYYSFISSTYELPVFIAFLLFYIVVYWSIYKTKKERGEFYYLLYLDGLILLKGVLFLIFALV